MPSLKNPDFFTLNTKGFKETAVCVGVWGHGEAPNADLHGIPGILIVDDGHDIVYAFKCMNKRTLRETAAALAPVFIGLEDGDVARYSDGLLTAEEAPEGFWVKDDCGNAEPNPAAFPDIVAW